jgi:hypothetical protein
MLGFDSFIANTLNAEIVIEPVIDHALSRP